MVTVYSCGKCNHLISKSSRVCPHCDVTLSGIRCKSCGFFGSEKDFSSDRCPKCKSVVYVNRHNPAAASAIMDTSKKYKRKKKSSDWVCPHCGYAKWGSIISLGIFSLLCIGAAIILSPYIGSSGWRLMVRWGCGIFGLLLLFTTISDVIAGIKTPKRATS